MPVVLAVAAHPSLALAAFETLFPAPLGELPSPAWLTALFARDAQAPLAPDEAVRAAVRDMLRVGGYKPTGRGKPASEYLVRASGESALGSINLAVDACNAVSLHSGLPISLVDADLLASPLAVRLAGDERYVFNRAGQEIRVAGLLCLHDAAGPSANAVRDSQRTKTSAATRRTVSLVWGCRGHDERLHAATAWYRELLARAGAVTAACELVFA